MIAVGLLLVVVVVAGIAIGIRTATRSSGGGVPGAHGMRRFFTYLVLYGLFVVSGIGVAGLLGQVLDRGGLVSADAVESARNGAFVVVGLPFGVALTVWLWRILAADAEERESLSWAAYVTVASLTALIVSMAAAHDVLDWAVGPAPYDGRALGRLIVWSGLWGGHWWLDRRLTPDRRALPHLLAGSLIGLATAVTGLVGLVAGTLDVLLGLGGAVLVDDGERARGGGITLLVGAAVWLGYWVLTAVRRDRSRLWSGYVLFAGIGAGAVLGLVGAGRAVLDVLVWLVGEPDTRQAAVHFRGVSTALAAAAVGLAVWWYHRGVLGESGRGPRTEVRRVFEYLMTGIGLVAGAAGAVLLLVGVVEAGTRSADLAGTSAVNGILRALTLLLVGTPVWWLQWHRTQALARSAPEPECAAPSRRIYLLLVAGLGVLTALGALLTGVFLVFEDAFGGGVALTTLRHVRYPVGLLLVAGAAALYHSVVHRRERAVDRTAARRPRFVLLVGPRDPDLADAVARGVGGRVRSWPRTDHDDAPWSADGVTALVQATHAESVVVVADADGLHAIPVDRH